MEPTLTPPPLILMEVSSKSDSKWIERRSVSDGRISPLVADDPSGKNSIISTVNLNSIAADRRKRSISIEVRWSSSSRVSLWSPSVFRRWRNLQGSSELSRPGAWDRWNTWNQSRATCRSSRSGNSRRKIVALLTHWKHCSSSLSGGELLRQRRSTSRVLPLLITVRSFL